MVADCQLPEVAPHKDYSVEIDIDVSTIYDENADDNYFLHQFDDVAVYTDKKHGVCLEWSYYTPGRARQIIEYIKAALQCTDCVEIWHLWLMDYYEYDDRPVFRRSTVHIDDLTVDDIQEIDAAKVWNNHDKNRPSFYCLAVIR